MLNLLRASGGWVTKNAFSAGVSRRPTTGNQRQSFITTSPTALSARFHVGDVVNITKSTNPGDSPLLQGTIQEVKRGWYAVQPIGDDNGNSPINCRAAQLTLVEPGSIEGYSLPKVNVLDTIPPFTDITTAAPASGSVTSTIYDLDALLTKLNNDPSYSLSPEQDPHQVIPQIQHFSTFDKWVIFTDLHCAPSSLDTCLKVLERVHELAVQHNAGVLFLGDFWHTRGTLRVDVLNDVLAQFATWTVPLIMIPGNHDQVTLGGHSHGLTALQNAYRVQLEDGTYLPGPLILSYPTKFLNALFVPHIRTLSKMEAIVQSELAHSQESTAALFVHADVTGAYMNDRIISTGGVAPTCFPSNRPIYSGHFHKPHVVETSSKDICIEYLGSPYETSLAEAQQPKALAIVSSNNGWKVEEYVPMNIGRKHYQVESWEGLLEINAKSGDRIVVTISPESVASIPRHVQECIQSLRKYGTAVEIREVKQVPTESMGNPEAAQEWEELLTPESTWKAFIEDAVQREAMSSTKADAIFEAGMKLLEEIESDQEGSGAELRNGQFSNGTDLRLGSVTIQGFGPFKEQVTYPLLDRGLVLLRGSNRDGGSDSNGSGKSSLSMAALWALTGSLDARRVQDAKVGDIVNDDSKAAKVTVEGSLNGIPFEITRVKAARSGALTFVLNGSDLTAQSVKETQLLLDEKLGVNSQLLSRTMFHGQHAMNGLLEATDAKLKEELSLILPLGLWQDAASLGRLKSRESNKRAAELNGMISLRAEDVETLGQRLLLAESELNAKEKKLGEAQDALEAERQKSTAAFSADATGESASDIDSIQLLLEDTRGQIKTLEMQQREFLEQKESELGPLKRSLEELELSLSSSLERLQSHERDLFAADLKLEAARSSIASLEEKWAIDLSTDETPDIVINTETCPTCQQPLSSDGIGHSHIDLQRVAEEEIRAALDSLSTAVAAGDSSRDRMEVERDSLERRKGTLADMKLDLQRGEERWASDITGVEQDLRSLRAQESDVADRLTTLAKSSRQDTTLQSFNAPVQAAQAAVDYAKATILSVSDEISQAKQKLEDLNSEMEFQNKESKMMSDLGEAFGQRGVQTFVLQNVVGALQSATQIYLDELSDGAQRLELSLDAGDRISRTAYIRGPDGAYKERPLSSLSGGQWRRCSLALTLGFAELVARKGKLRPSVIVLDEPLTHLDRSGRTKVGDLLRKMLHPTGEDTMFGPIGGLGMSTIVLILQDLAAEEIEEAFDSIDEVVKDGGTSYLRVDEYV